MIRLHFANLGHELRAFPVRNLAVIERNFDEHRRVIRLLYVVVGRILLHVIVSRLFVRITPFDVLAGRQRQRSVEHCIENIDERHLGHYGFEQIGTHVGDGAHQQPAGAATLNYQTVAGGVLLFHHMFGAGDEVGEGVYLIHHAAGFAPGFTQFAAAANVRDDIDDAAIEQSQTAG